MLAQWATYHASHRSVAGDLCDFQDGSVYEEDIMNDPHFAADPRNLFGALSTDGLQPFVDDKKYSMWPVVFTFYNFPPHVRYLLGLTTLLCVIPGSRLPASRINPNYAVQIVMDELELMSYGVWLSDASKTIPAQQRFLCRVKMVQVSN